MEPQSEGLDAEDLAVHFDGDFFFDWGQPELSLGVEGISAFVGVPFVLGEAGVVVGIDDGVLGLGEWDFAEGVAEAEAAKGDWFEPSWDSDAKFYDWQLVIG